MAEGRDENPGSAPLRDDVLRKRDFRRPRGMDLGSFMVNSNQPAEEPESVESEPHEEVDEAEQLAYKNACRRVKSFDSRMSFTSILEILSAQLA